VQCEGIVTDFWFFSLFSFLRYDSLFSMILCFLIFCGCFRIRYIVEKTTSMSVVERQFGVMPTNSLEDFSLWLAALAPLPETEKVAVLKGTSTKERFQTCIRGLQQYIQQIQNRTSPSSASARAASRSVEAVLSTMSNSASTATTTIGNFFSALLGGTTVVEETVEGNRNNDQNDGSGSMSPEARRNFLVVTEEIVPAFSSSSPISSSSATVSLNSVSSFTTNDNNQPINTSNGSGAPSSTDPVPFIRENITTVRPAEDAEA
jgi:hypothetical protein